jgi:hypothetical protein
MSLYALNTSYTGANTGAYCSVSLTAGSLVDGVGQCMPTQPAFTYMSFQGAITYQVPAGDASVGGTVEATSNVAGTVIVSPPINVGFNVELWGQGKVLGSYTLPAGQSEGQFNFSVSQADGLTIEEVHKVLEDKIAKPPTSR